MDEATKSRTIVQTLFGVGVVTAIASAVAVTMGTQWVFRGLRDAFEGAWDDLYLGDDDEFNPPTWRDPHSPIAP